MGKKIRWGLLGAGSIVDSWMMGLLQCDDCEVTAVSSRTEASARKVADRWNLPKVETYEQMCGDPEIDVVYIPVPHTQHKELAIMAMEHGKSVLCEKPSAVNAGELREMTTCAKKNNVFFMEAAWTRFFPVTEKMLEMVRSGRIGDVRHVQASFSFRCDDGTNNHLTDPNRAGGGMLDVGIYTLHFAYSIFQRMPQKLVGLASFDTDDMHLQVDEQASYVAQYDDGALATLSCGIRTSMQDFGYVYGTKGYIFLPHFWHPERMDIYSDGQTETVELPVPQKIEGIHDSGYQYEIAYVNDCLRKGLKEAPKMPYHESLEVLQEIDKLRADWGFYYPSEKV